MEFVAEMCPDNVRQLEGGMNRVIAFASLMRSDVTLDIAREVLGHEKAPGKTKKVELAERTAPTSSRSPGRSAAYELLGAKIDAGYRGLVFSRSNPASVRERLGGRTGGDLLADRARGQGRADGAPLPGEDRPAGRGPYPHERGRPSSCWTTSTT